MIAPELRETEKKEKGSLQKDMATLSVNFSFLVNA